MTKKNLLIIAFVALIAISIPIVNPDLLSRKNPIKSAKNFVVYYSIVASEDIDRIHAYDLAIINVAGITDRILARLKSSDTLLYSYVSVVAVEKSDALKNSLMGEEDYLHINGERVYNAQYDCNYGDILSENYQQILLRIVRERVLEKGFDGAFIDTLDDIEFLSDPYVRQAQFTGYMNFYKRLKKEYPGLSIIQNRGFSLYTQGSSHYVDGLLFEDLKYGDEKATDSSPQMLNMLTSTALKADNVILAISHENRMVNYTFCKQQKWLYYYSSYTNNYMKFEDSIENVDLK